MRSFGSGDVSTYQGKALLMLKEMKVPVVVTTQAPQGSCTFQVNNPGKYLADNQLAIPTFDMSLEAITVKTMWLLGQGTPYEQFHDAMLRDMHGEIHNTGGITTFNAYTPSSTPPLAYYPLFTPAPIPPPHESH